jgi:hypothetical protein
LPLNHFFFKKIKLKPVHRLVLVRLFYGKNLKQKKKKKKTKHCSSILSTVQATTAILPKPIVQQPHKPTLSPPNPHRPSPSSPFFSIAIINHTHSQLHHPENQFPSSSSYYQEKL